MKTRSLVIKPLSTEQADDYTLLEEKLPAETRCAKACKILGKSYKKALVINSTACDTAMVTLGIKKTDRKLLGFIETSNGVLATITALYFAQSWRVNGPEIEMGIDNTTEMLTTRRMPAEWEKLSFSKELTAGVLSFLFAIYSGLAEGTATYGFLTDLEVNETLAGILACLYVKSSWASESRTGWEKTRNFFIKSDHVHNRFQFSKLLSYSLALFSAAGATILGFDGIQSTFSIENQGLKISIFVAGLTKGATDGSYNEKKNHEGLDSVIDEITNAIANRQCPSLFQFSTVIGSMFFGSLVADSVAVIYTNALSTPALPFTMPEFLPPVLGYGIGISQGVTATYGTHTFLTLIKDTIVNAFRRCRNRQHEDEEEIIERKQPVSVAKIKINQPEKEAFYIQPEKYYRMKNVNLHFAPKPPLPKVEVVVIPSHTNVP